jgi:hypothetical protein
MEGHDKDHRFVSHSSGFARQRFPPCSNRGVLPIASLITITDKETPENVTQLFLKHQDEIILTLVKFQQSLEQTKGT